MLILAMAVLAIQEALLDSDWAKAKKPFET